MKRSIIASLSVPVLVNFVVATGLADTDTSRDSAPSITTECSNESGDCAGEVYSLDSGAAGSITCNCVADEGESKSVTADLEAESGTGITQEELDTGCISLLKECLDKTSDSDSDTAASTGANRDSKDASSNCSFAKIPSLKEKSLSSLLYAVLKIHHF